MFSENEIERMSEHIREINDRMSEINKIYFNMIAEDMQLLMRAYEMLFIGITDLSKDELKDEIIDHLFARVGPDKFKLWCGDAGQSNRDWGYLWEVGDKNDTKG